MLKLQKALFCTVTLGIQYTSRLFQDYLSSKEILHSFSREGNPYDNTCIESFHSILKKEEVNHHKYFDFNVAHNVIFEYIEFSYNWYQFISVDSKSLIRHNKRKVCVKQCSKMLTVMLRLFNIKIFIRYNQSNTKRNKISINLLKI